MNRTVKAVFGLREAAQDPAFEKQFAEFLKASYSGEELLAFYSRYSWSEDRFDRIIRRVIFRSLCRSLGDDLELGVGVGFKHPETFEIGSCIFIGSQSFIQGRADGNCRIGSHVWMGPQSYFDARSLVIEDYVGWGPGAKVVGSLHTGQPTDVPIITTDLIIKPVVIGYGADIGVNAVILPGVRVGRNSIVGAGAVVVKDVPDDAIVAGAPAQVIKMRNRGSS